MNNFYQGFNPIIKDAFTSVPMDFRIPLTNCIVSLSRVFIRITDGKVTISNSTLNVLQAQMDGIGNTLEGIFTSILDSIDNRVNSILNLALSYRIPNILYPTLNNAINQIKQPISQFLNGLSAEFKDAISLIILPIKALLPVTLIPGVSIPIPLPPGIINVANTAIQQIANTLTDSLTAGLTVLINHTISNILQSLV